MITGELFESDWGDIVFDWNPRELTDPDIIAKAIEDHELAIQSLQVIDPEIMSKTLGEALRDNPGNLNILF